MTESPTPLPLLRFDGQEIELDPEIAQDDQSILDALATWHPKLAEARFERTVQQGRLVITATKVGGTKGGFAQHLDAQEDALHPALALLLEFDALERAGDLTQDLRLARHADIEAALDAIRADLHLLERFIHHLDQATPAPTRVIPLGF